MRTALITGATGGIGSCLVERLVAQGQAVDGWYHKDEASRRRLELACRDLPGTLRMRSVDVTDWSAIADAASDADTPQLVVHAAGAIPRPAEWNLASAETVRHTLEVNLTSALALAREIGPRMVEAGKGHIMFISSAYALDAGAAPVLSYTAAKAGLTAVTRGLAAELSPRGVRVNAVAPSNVDTRMTESAGHETIEWAIATTPLGRLADPSEVVDLIVAIDGIEYITGTIIPIDGGQSLVI